MHKPGEGPGGPIETYKKKFAENFLKYFFIFFPSNFRTQNNFHIFFGVKWGPKNIILLDFSAFFSKLAGKSRKSYFWTPFNRKKYMKIILGTEILWEKIKKYFKNFSAKFFLYVSIGPPGTLGAQGGELPGGILKNPFGI